MVQSAFLPVEGAHLAAATDVVAIKRTYQRSGFACESEIKGFLYVGMQRPGTRTGDRIMELASLNDLQPTRVVL